MLFMAHAVADGSVDVRGLHCCQRQVLHRNPVALRGLHSY